MRDARSNRRSKRRSVWAKREASASRVGLLALGSHEERHGAALPIDTDAKLAAHVALEAAKRTGAKFLGVLYSSYELPGIDTGNHQTLDRVLDELRSRLGEAKKTLGIKAAVLVNAHGGNRPLREHLGKLEREVGLKLRFNSKLTELEGPHAGTGELSMGSSIGIADASKLAEHLDFERHPEVGFVGLEEARKRYPWAERHAREVLEQGVRIDKTLGNELLKRVIASVIKNIRC